MKMACGENRNIHRMQICYTHQSVLEKGGFEISQLKGTSGEQKRQVSIGVIRRF